MLDDVTKKRINTLRQILVGKLPDPKAQVEQITNGLIYKFMNDMDEQSVSLGGKASYFSGKFEKYSWKNLMNSKTSGSDRLELYKDAIEKMYNNENLPELFREIFKNSFLPFKDPSTLNMFLKEINEFHYSNSEKLGDAFEYLLSFMGSQGDAGQFRTPRHIIDFIIEIVNPQKNETILDPACGTAGFLISTYKHILKQNTKKNLGDGLTASDRKKIGENLNGYDISPDMVKMSLVNMYLHKFTNPKINEYDTLSSEERWNEYYDVILANPPFFSPKGGIMPHNRFGVKSPKAEILFIDYIIEHLKPNGRAGIIIPEGVIFQNGIAYKQIRKKLIENSLCGVISLPAGIFQPYSGVKTSILILDKSRSKSSKNIFFININDDGYELNAKRTKIINQTNNDLEKSILELNNNEKSKKIENSLVQFVSKKEILDNESFLLIYKQYQNFVNLNKNLKFLKLKDVILSLNDGDWIESKDQSKEGIRLIQTGNIGKGNFLNKETKTRYVSEETFEKLKCTQLKKGQILVSRLPEPVGRCCYVPERQEKMITSVDVSIVEFNEKILKSSFFLYLSLSDNYNNEISKFLTGSSRQRISKENLKKLNLPCPSLEVQNQIVEELDNYQKIIEGCKQVVENYKPSIDIDPKWEMIELGEICDVKGGKRLPKGENFENGKTKYPYIRVADFENYSIDKKNIKYISEKNYLKIKNYIISSDDIYISIAGTIGLVGRVSTEFSGSNLTENAAKIIVKNKNTILVDYLMYVLGSPYAQSQIKNKTHAVGVPKLALERIKKIKIPICAIDVQKNIVDNITLDFETVENNKKLLEKNQNIIKNKINSIWSN